jgi:hypothetical protein
MSKQKLSYEQWSPLWNAAYSEYVEAMEQLAEDSKPEPPTKGQSLRVGGTLLTYEQQLENWHRRYTEYMEKKIRYQTAKRRLEEVTLLKVFDS